MQPYAALADAVLLIHLLWCAWIVFGWTLTRGRRVLTWLHIGSLVYAIFIELTPWPPCPLTVAENWLEMRAGLVPASGPFLLHLLDAIVYPNLPEWAVVGAAVAICLAILAIYLRRFVKRPSSQREFFRIREEAIRKDPDAVKDFLRDREDVPPQKHD
ncbi:MAG TPA: DUF2784 domain-containing protein [Candidatus Acidoferrum sp.]|nr:DUF2784 domain-containing protein [Candidatus Acidoferrum sp.]